VAALDLGTARLDPRRPKALGPRATGFVSIAGLGVNLPGQGRRPPRIRRHSAATLRPVVRGAIVQGRETGRGSSRSGVPWF